MKIAFELYDLKGSGFISKDDALRAFMALGHTLKKDDLLLMERLAQRNQKQQQNPIESPALTLSFDDFSEFYTSKIVREPLS